MLGLFLYSCSYFLWIFPERKLKWLNRENSAVISHKAHSDGKNDKAHYVLIVMDSPD